MVKKISVLSEILTLERLFVMAKSNMKLHPHGTAGSTGVDVEKFYDTGDIVGLFSLENKGTMIAHHQPPVRDDIGWKFAYNVLSPRI